MPEVRVHGLTKIFRTATVALRHVSFPAPTGRVTVIVGPSGSGKTTLLRIIAGLEDPSEGEVLIDNRQVTSLPPWERGVAMIFQRYSLYPNHTIKKNLALAQEKSLSTEPEGDRIVGWLQLTDLLSRLPGELSGGQQQRAALARALLHGKPVLLLDEPLSAVDPGLRGELRRQLSLLQRELQLTVLYVTHDQQEAQMLADQLVVIREGKIEQVGAPADIYFRPANRFVAGFIGSPPMSFLEGHLRVEGSGTYLTGRDWKLPVNHWRKEMPKGTVVAGCRPEHIRITAYPTEESSIKMTVELVEAAGPNEYIWLHRDDGRLTALTSRPSGYSRGNIVAVCLDMNETRWFDGVTGKALDETG
jgi:multiple sugar transport system ATP-binding protein